MLSKHSQPRLMPGTHVRVVQHVRVGHRKWTTDVTGVVESEGVRPVGGMEMGTKGLITRQPTLRLRRADGEVTVVALDENTEIHPVSAG